MKFFVHEIFVLTSFYLVAGMFPPKFLELQVKALQSKEDLIRMEKNLRPAENSEPVSLAKNTGSHLQAADAAGHQVKSQNVEGSSRNVSTSSPVGNLKDLKRQTKPESQMEDLSKQGLDLKRLEDTIVENLVKVMKEKVSLSEKKYEKALMESEESHKSELEKSSTENKSLLKLNEDLKEELKGRAENSIKLEAELKEVKDQNEVKNKSFEAEKTSLEEQLLLVMSEKTEISKESEVLKGALEKAIDKEKAAVEASRDLEAKLEELRGKMEEQDQRGKKVIERLEAELGLRVTREEEARQDVEEINLRQSREIQELREEMQVLKVEKERLTNQLTEENLKHSTNEISESEENDKRLLSQLKALSQSTTQKIPDPSEEHSYTKRKISNADEEHSYTKRTRLEDEESSRSKEGRESEGMDSGKQGRFRLKLKDLSTVLKEKEDSPDFPLEPNKEGEGEEGELRRREADDIMALKCDVAEDVKSCLMKIRMSSQIRKVIIENDQDFSNLARKLSVKIREGIMERHQMCNNNLVGVSLSQQDREEIIDQVRLYFVMNDIIRECLCLLRPEFSEVQHEYKELVGKFCEEFHQKVGESIRVLRGSLKEEEVRICYEKTIYYCISQTLDERESGLEPRIEH